jgi:hypothetical protein
VTSGAAAGLLVVVSARLLEPEPAAPPAASAGDRMLKAAEASRLFGVSRSWLYEHGHQLGFARRPEGIRGVLFSERELRRWSDARGL